MKIKLKKKAKLPNAWKQYGISFEDWEDLQDGKKIEVKSIPDLEGIEVFKTKEKGDK